MRVCEIYVKDTNGRCGIYVKYTYAGVINLRQKHQWGCGIYVKGTNRCVYNLDQKHVMGRTYVECTMQGGGIDYDKG